MGRELTPIEEDAFPKLFTLLHQTALLLQLGCQHSCRSGGILVKLWGDRRFGGEAGLPSGGFAGQYIL
jgi:hypothetical protein